MLLPAGVKPVANDVADTSGALLAPIADPAPTTPKVAAATKAAHFATCLPMYLPPPPPPRSPSPPPPPPPPPPPQRGGGAGTPPPPPPGKVLHEIPQGKRS